MGFAPNVCALLLVLVPALVELSVSAFGPGDVEAKEEGGRISSGLGAGEVLSDWEVPLSELLTFFGD